jgi:hypothetical protein
MREGDTRFETALADCCERLRTGDDAATVIASHPEAYQAQLARLVPLASRVRLLGMDPSSAFRARLLSDLRSSTPERAGAPSALTTIGRWLRAKPLARLAAAILVVLLALGGADAVAASESTLPDNPLYQVKATREWMEVSLTRDPGARAMVHLRQIALRELELEKAIQSRRSPRVVEAVAGRLAAATERMVDAATDARARGNPAAAGQAVTALRVLDQRLATLASQSRQPWRPILVGLRQDLRLQSARLDLD